MSRLRYPAQNNIRWIWGLLTFAGSAGLLIVPVEMSAVFLTVVVFCCLCLITPVAALAGLLILAPLRTLIATESALQLPLDIGQILFAFFLLIWVIRRVTDKQPVVAFQYSPLYLPVAGFVLATALTVFNAQSHGFWLSEWLKWVIVLFMCGFIYMLCVHRPCIWRWIINIMILAGCANAVVGLYIFFGGSGADHLLISNRFFRAFGTFGQPNPFGGFMGLMLPLALMRLYAQLDIIYCRWRTGISSHTWFIAGFYTIACTILLAGLVASWSRGAWLGFIIAIGVMIFALPRKFWQSLLLVMTGSVLVGGVWLSGILPQSIMLRVTSSTEELFTVTDVRGVDITTANYAIVERLAHWQAALNMAREHPWAGIGFGNYEVAYNQYQLTNWDEALGHAHNYYLNIMAEAGIMGFLTYMVMWVSIVFITWRIRSHPDNQIRLTAAGLLGTWAYLAAHSFLDNLYVNNLFLHIGALLGVLAFFHYQTWHVTRWDYHVTGSRSG
jgi:O-antigen ligase